MNKNLLKFPVITALSLMTALCISFLLNRDAAEHSTLYLSAAYEARERAGVSESVRLYNKLSASFYNTGGYVEGLDEIPAAPLVKRRLFKDINMLKSDGLLMVFDRDRVEESGISFRNRTAAIAETEETWLVSLQEIETRKPVFNVKASQVRVRYLLEKRPFPRQEDDEKWIVREVDVYPLNEEIPEFERGGPVL
jgi:hypothetical protein